MTDRFLAGVRRWTVDTARDAAKAAVAAFCALTMGATIFSVDGAVDMSLVERGGISALGAAVAVVLTRANAWATRP